MNPQASLLIGLVILLQVSACPISAQIIYVNQNATGTNDGTSWQDAYSNLESALAGVLDSGSLWIAKGTYHPGGSTPDNASVFSIGHNISLYGGFVGNEINLKDRNPLLHQTILSGDINEDDVIGDFTNNKSDNTHHVVYVDSLLDLVTFDGLIISGGHTLNFQNSPLYDRAGGGLHINSPVIINECQIKNHFGREGGGLFLNKGASATSITNTVFSNNKTSQRGACIYALTLSNLLVEQCEFFDNEVNRGAIASSNSTDVLLENCLFRDNHNTTSNGGAIFSFQNIDLVVNKCDFIHNSAIIGGAIVVNGDQIPAGKLTNISIEDCKFLENTASGSAGAVYVLTNPDTQFKNCEFTGDSSGFGGAIYIEQPEHNSVDTYALRIDSCLFSNCKAGNAGGGAIFMKHINAKIVNSLFEHNWTNGLIDGGGHIFSNCPGKNIYYSNNQFLNGVSGGYGGAIITFGQNSQNEFDDCLFSNNISDKAGGAVHNARGVVSSFNHCLFKGNESINGSGGALAIAFDSTTIKLTNSYLHKNQASESGGAIHSDAGSGIINIDQCTIDSNKTLTGFGGAIFINETGDDNIGSLIINNSLIGYNQSTIQGGALNIVDTDTRITNTVFFENTCSVPGIGAAMAIKATNQDTLTTIIINSTLVNNYGNFAGGIAQETENMDAVLTTTVQNCIFNNQGFSNYTVEGGMPGLRSNGGNMSDDQSMVYFLTSEKDTNGVSPVFNNVALNDYSLISNSPGIDGGVIDGAPAFDILGHSRVNTPDIGAYEHQSPTKTVQPKFNAANALLIYPNPVCGQDIELIIMSKWNGPLEVNLLDESGKTIKALTIDKTSEEFRFSISILELPPAIYTIIATDELRTWTSRFIRI